MAEGDGEPVELEVGAVDDDQTAGAGGELVEERAGLADLEAAPRP